MGKVLVVAQGAKTSTLWVTFECLSWSLILRLQLSLKIKELVDMLIIGIFSKTDNSFI